MDREPLPAVAGETREDAELRQMMNCLIAVYGRRDSFNLIVAMQVNAQAEDQIPVIRGWPMSQDSIH